MSHFVVDFDPNIISIGFLKVRWYSLMYIIAYILGTFLAKKLVKQKFFKVPLEKVDELVSYVFVGMIIGARLFYVVLYNWDFYKNQSLLESFAIWHGGLSFHGALVGFIISAYFFSRRNKISWLQVLDTLALVGPPGLFFGRLGNFMNGELYGRISSVPWAMIFPAGGPNPRHPSQLYEAIFEGLVSTLLVWLMYKKKLVKHHGVIAFSFCIFYGIFRFFIEFFREADAQLGYYLNDTFSMGQILCFIMILIGIIGVILSIKQKKMINNN